MLDVRKSQTVKAVPASRLLLEFLIDLVSLSVSPGHIDERTPFYRECDKEVGNVGVIMVGGAVSILLAIS